MRWITTIQHEVYLEEEKSTTLINKLSWKVNTNSKPWKISKSSMRIGITEGFGKDA